MRNRILLYIDILGFSELVSGDTGKIDDLYEVIASLNAHHHDAFRCEIFSDTILIYNVDGGDNPADVSYLLMFQCEFVKDLMHRLTNRGIVFRAVITDGSFRHYQLNEVPCYYGSALIDAHESEKNIKAIGLFMRKRLVPYSDIFPTTHFNDEYDFVYITQALNEVEVFCDSDVPGAGQRLDATDGTWIAGPELMHLADLLRGLRSDLPEHVRLKYETTVKLYRLQYPKIIACLERNDLDIQSVVPDAEWSGVVDRLPEDFSYAIKSREEF